MKLAPLLSLFAQDLALFVFVLEALSVLALLVVLQVLFVVGQGVFAQLHLLFFLAHPEELGVPLFADQLLIQLLVSELLRY